MSIARGVCMDIDVNVEINTNKQCLNEYKYSTERLYTKNKQTKNIIIIKLNKIKNSNYNILIIHT